MKDRDAETRYANQLGENARLQGDYAKAKHYYEIAKESVERNLGRKPAGVLGNLGFVALHRKDLSLSRSLFEQAVQLHIQRRQVGDVAVALTGFAGISVARQSPIRAAQLLGASTNLIGGILESLEPADRMEYDQILDSVQSQLDQQTFAQAFEAGRALTMEQAIELALREGTTNG